MRSCTGLAGTGSRRRLAWRRLACAAAAAACASVGAQTEGRSAFRVCQDPNNLPFSNTRGEGFENKIAELFARELNLPVTYYSFPQRLGFIRNTLRFKLPGEDFRCDVVMGVPAGYDQVSATKPYYRSAYMLVFAKGNGLDGVKNSDDLLKLPQDRLKKLRIGLYNRTPGSEWLAHHGLVDQAVPYPILNPDPDQYPGQIIERDLAGGKIDAAIVWGPLAGYFASRVRQPQLVVVPMKPEQDIKFDFSIAMGVRYGEAQWKQQIEALIARMRPQIREILKSYNVPVLEDEVTAAGAN